MSLKYAVARIRHTQDSQDQILVLAFGGKSVKPFKLLHVRLAAAASKRFLVAQPPRHGQGTRGNIYMSLQGYVAHKNPPPP